MSTLFRNIKANTRKKQLNELKEIASKKWDSLDIIIYWEFPGGPVVRTPKGVGSIPGWGTKIPKAAQCGQKKSN